MLSIIKEQIVKIWSAGGVHVILGNFLNKFVAFFGSIFVVRILSKSEYGELSYIENLYNFIYLVAGIGLSNAVLRYVVLENSLEGKKSVFNYMIRLAFLVNIGLVFLGIIINHFYPHSAEFDSAELLLCIMLLMLPAQYINDNYLTLQRAMFDNKRFAYLNFFYAVIVIMGKCVGASIYGILGVIIIGVIIQYSYSLFLGLNSKRKYFSKIKYYKLNFDKKKEIILYAFQYMITNGIWSLFMLLDIFLLGVFINSAADIANYKVAYAWPANISIICSAVGIFVSPYFIKNEKNLEWIRRNFKNIFAVNFLIVLIISIIMYIAAKPLIFIYGGREYYDTIPVMRMLIISSTINNGLRYMTANCLAAMGQIRYNMIVSIIGIIMQIILNIYFIPLFGIYGPAYSGMISYTLMAIILFIAFDKKYKILRIER